MSQTTITTLYKFANFTSPTGGEIHPLDGGHPMLESPPCRHLSSAGFPNGLCSYSFTTGFSSLMRAFFCEEDHAFAFGFFLESVEQSHFRFRYALWHFNLKIGAYT